MKKTIGIIGFGRLGQLLVKYLSLDFEVYVYDLKKDYVSQIKNLGATPCDLKTACSQDIILPIVPISKFENVLKRMKPHLKGKRTVIDVCSVKEHPINLMKKILPKNIQILGSHPMFGPDSAKKSLKNQKIVLCKERIKDADYSCVRKYLEKKKLTIIEVTPEDHDEQIANSLLLTHFIGRGLLKFGAENLLIDTIGYRRLMKILLTVKNDSWQLFHDMNYYNNFSKDARNNFLKALKSVSKGVEL